VKVNLKKFRIEKTAKKVETTTTVKLA